MPKRKRCSQRMRILRIISDDEIEVLVESEEDEQEWVLCGYNLHRQIVRSVLRFEKTDEEQEAPFSRKVCPIYHVVLKPCDGIDVGNGLYMLKEWNREGTGGLGFVWMINTCAALGISPRDPNATPGGVKLN